MHLAIEIEIQHNFFASIFSLFAYSLTLLFDPKVGKKRDESLCLFYNSLTPFGSLAIILMCVCASFESKSFVSVMRFKILWLCIVANIALHLLTARWWLMQRATELNMRLLDNKDWHGQRAMEFGEWWNRDTITHMHSVNNNMTFEQQNKLWAQSEEHTPTILFMREQIDYKNICSISSALQSQT